MTLYRSVKKKVPTQICKNDLSKINKSMQDFYLKKKVGDHSLSTDWKGGGDGRERDKDGGRQRGREEGGREEKRSC